MISDDELLALGEFALLGENAAQAGVDGPLPAVTRVERGPISALRWGTERPRVVFLHGGGQNAHTWDTVIVGMSLGGLTALRLAVTTSDLVRTLVMVDVTPSAPERHEQMTKAQMGAVALVQGDRNFPTFAAMVDVTVGASPHRSRESLRRGVFHNSQELPDGTWTWRYDTFRNSDGFEGLWDDAARLSAPTTLVRGANSFFVNDDDAAEFARIAPGFQQVIVVPDSGHSVQGDQPRALVEILRTVLGHPPLDRGA